MKNVETREPALGAPLQRGGGGRGWRRGSKGPCSPQMSFSGAQATGPGLQVSGPVRLARGHVLISDPNPSEHTVRFVAVPHGASLDRPDNVWRVILEVVLGCHSSGGTPEGDDQRCSMAGPPAPVFPHPPPPRKLRPCPSHGRRRDWIDLGTVA